mgnify:CR=1 FL=1
MFLVAGLGNPGKKYNHSRHNIGFDFLDYLAARNSLDFKESKWEADVVKTNLWDTQIILAKPLTYMNNSGRAVRKIRAFYGIDSENVIVIHDDLDLETGRIKIAFNRGAGGHNGIKSIISHLGTREFVRIKVGIDKTNTGESVSNYVLSRFSKEQMEIIRDTLPEIEVSLGNIVTNGFLEAMSRTNAGN